MRLKKYLEELFGNSETITGAVSAVPLPLFLKNGYDLSVRTIHGVRALFAKPRERETPAALKTHSGQLSEAFGLPCVIWLEEIDYQERKRLCQNGTQFVLPGVIFFAPDIGISINERIKEVRKQMPAIFTPLTQTVYLYLLYNRRRFQDRPVSYSALCNETKLNIMTVKRAVDAMALAGLAEVGRGGIRFLPDQAEYVEKALPFLANPVKERFFVTGKDFEEYFEGIPARTYAGTDALQYVPCISDSRQIAGDDGTFAFAKKDITGIPKAVGMPRRYERSDIEIQVWNYALTGYGESRESDTAYPEPLSLYLSLRNTADERVQGALEELLEGIKNDGRA